MVSIHVYYRRGRFRPVKMAVVMAGSYYTVLNDINITKKDLNFVKSLDLTKFNNKDKVYIVSEALYLDRDLIGDVILNVLQKKHINYTPYQRIKKF